MRVAKGSVEPGRCKSMTTYKIPNKKVAITPTFGQKPNFNLRSSNMGMIRIKVSIPRWVDEAPYSSFVSSMKQRPCTLSSQKADKGMQCTIPRVLLTDIIRFCKLY